ncbi:MAG: beta-L-arabinofuranosidase domain-containing protein [Fidelibacterota bacterium]
MNFKKLLQPLTITLMFLLICQCTTEQEMVREPMPEYAEFAELPITAIQPRGWLKTYLEKQKEGLTGNLEKVGYPFNTIGWAGDSIPENQGTEEWWPYEQVAYWLDGMIRLGYLLDDQELINRARKSFDYVLEHADEDGYLGPKAAKANLEGDRWVHAVFFRALLAYYSSSGKEEIIDAMTTHFLKDTLTKFATRVSINGEAVMKLYGITGDPELLELGKRIYNSPNEIAPNAFTSDKNLMKDEMMNEHGVTYNERAKMGAIMSMYTGDQSLLEVSQKAYEKIDKYYMLIDGVNVSSEQLNPLTATESHETCDIADYTWSIGYLLMATGNADYADKIERAIFNAAPGSVKPDFKALQYFSSPNQIVADQTSFARDGGNRQCFAPNFAPQCCTGNINRIMPNFAARMWMKDQNNGLVATMYAPSTVTCKVGNSGKKVTVHEKTQYPFKTEIDFVFEMESAVKFPFTFRMPGWATTIDVRINGETYEVTATSQNYVTIDRKFKNNDKISIDFGKKLNLVEGPDNGVSIERGPLVYALKIGEDWQVAEDNKYNFEDYPAYNVYPTTDWNYALCLSENNLEDLVEVTEKSIPADPWSAETAPIELSVPAKKIKGWDLQKVTEMQSEIWDVIRDPETGKVVRWEMKGHRPKYGEFYFTPPLPDRETIAKNIADEMEKVTLIPYGCTNLRITVFPRCK